MSLFDKLKKAAGELADGASRQAEMLKLQSELGHVEDNIERNLAEAGKRARELYRRKLLLDTEIEVIMKRVDEDEIRLDELRAQVQALRQHDTGASEQASSAAPPAPPVAPQPTPPQAPSAPQPPQPPTPPGGVEVTAPAAYRPPTQDSAPADPSVQHVLCPECGGLVREDARFCNECGHKLAADEG